MLFPALLLAASSQQLEIVKEQLFVEWTTSSRIANVTIGLPSENEVDSVLMQVEQFREEIELAKGRGLSSTEIELDLPFLLVMLDGITMECSPKFAEQCIEHLSVFDDEFSGIAASRLLRMQYRAAIILGDQSSSEKARTTFWSLDNPHPEDVVVFTLGEIQEAFEDGNTSGARNLYDRLASQLNRKQTQYLRAPFADGYAKVARTTHEAMYGWFSLAEWLVDYGYEQVVVDAELVRWIRRLPNPPNISRESDDPRIALLALRRDVANKVQHGGEEVLEQLMILARAGDGRAAEQVLEHGNSKFSEEAIELLVKFPKRIKYSIEYWQLYVANLDIKNRNVQQARKRLSPIASAEGKYQSKALEMLNQIQELEFSTLSQAFGVSSYEELPTKLTKNFTLSAMQDLLIQCISICHEEGVDEWNKSALQLLLTNSEGVSVVLIAEANRLLGQCEKAIPLFNEAILQQGPSIQAIAGLADCTKDLDAMKKIAHDASLDDSSSYWYWLSNVRIIQWFIEDGGNIVEAQAKVNRLRKKDATLGGAQFMSVFNSLCR